MQEPRDGDFVAYVEALQRESAARLARQHLGVNDAFVPYGTAGSPTDPASHALPSAAPAQPDASPARRRHREANLFKALVAAVIGAASLLSWAVGGGAFSFIVGVVLLAYAAPKLLAAFREQARTPDSKAAIEQVFGRSATPTRGAKQ